MSTEPENGEEPAGEAELEVAFAALNVDNNQNNDSREEEEATDAGEVPGDAIDGWTPPPRNECPVCFLPLPLSSSLLTHTFCCGKTICCGCDNETFRACEDTGRADHPCPFCRTPAPRSDEEAIARLEARMEKNDPNAMMYLARSYLRGEVGLPKDIRKALDLTCRAAELGLPAANGALGYFFAHGRYVEKDLERADRFYKIAANKGDYYARCELGRLEEESGHDSVAMKHYKIAASAGVQDAVDALKSGYKDGHISKEEFAASLRAFQAAQDELKSEAREREARSRVKGQKGGR